MIDVNNGKLIIAGKTIPKGQVDILKVLLRESPISAFSIMELTGKAYVQYIQSLLRILVLYGIVIRVEVNGRPAYEINPELKEDIGKAIMNG